MAFFSYPIHFKFNIFTLASDFTATDADGNVIAYVRQKMFKLKEDIQIFSDESRSKQIFAIRADRWLDFSAAYGFFNAGNTLFGKVVRKGWRSVWRADYQIIDQVGQERYKIREENPWIKVLDALLSEIPLLGIFTGYFFNPAYLVLDQAGNTVARLKKQASFLSRKFEIQQFVPVSDIDNSLIMLSLMMVILLERNRG